MTKLYLALTTAAALFLGASHYFGWTFTSTETQKNVPRSIRDNPGSYRTHYLGGK